MTGRKGPSEFHRFEEHVGGRVNAWRFDDLFWDVILSAGPGDPERGQKLREQENRLTAEDPRLGTWYRIFLEYRFAEEAIDALSRHDDTPQAVERLHRAAGGYLSVEGARRLIKAAADSVRAMY